MPQNANFVFLLTLFGTGTSQTEQRLDDRGKGSSDSGRDRHSFRGVETGEPRVLPFRFLLSGYDVPPRHRFFFLVSLCL